MDFRLDEQQQAVRDLARQILSERATSERHRELEAAGESVDGPLWQALADAGLLGIALPEAHGGAGLGFVAVALVAEEIGRTVAKVPFLSTAVAASAIAEFAPADVAQRWLPGVVSGEVVLTSALTESGDVPTAARASGDGWALDGEVSFVPAGLSAAAVVLPAHLDDASGGGVGVFLVDPTAKGVAVERQETMAGTPEARLTLAGVRPVAVIRDPGGTGGTNDVDVVAWLRQRVAAGLCATAVGVTEAALTLTADYAREREQFGKPIATFQAVAQRVADAFIDVKAIRLTALQAAWRLSAGLPADDQVAIAKFWAADGGQRVVHAAQHVHGGTGVDREYPLHRYFTTAKSLELTLGGGTSHLLRFGDSLAGSPA